MLQLLCEVKVSANESCVRWRLTGLVSGTEQKFLEQRAQSYPVSCLEWTCILWNKQYIFCAHIYLNNFHYTIYAISTIYKSESKTFEEIVSIYITKFSCQLYSAITLRSNCLLQWTRSREISLGLMWASYFSYVLWKYHLFIIFPNIIGGIFKTNNSFYF